MDIGFFHNYSSDKANTGYQVHVQQLINALVKRGHNILGYFTPDENPLIKYYRRRELFKFIKDVDVIYIRASGGYDTERHSRLKYLSGKSLPVIWEINAPISEGIIRDNTPLELVQKMEKKRKKMSHTVVLILCARRN